ncbi:MAG: STAS domain-containing protein [Candidatus Omnitrophica bacterium]|nr:STAS domain-containing protein [Candidatus Omnitrophota bacterium]
MQVKLEDKSGVSVVFVKGDIDINTSPDIKKFFDELIKDRKEKVVINLGDVSYVDSSGLATFVEILKKLRSYGGKLKLTNLSSKVRGLFEITKLTKLFDIFDEETAAIGSFQSGS